MPKKNIPLFYLKIFRMPQGGSITLEMAPLLFFAYRHGFKWGAGAGAMSGLLQMLFGGYIAHPVQAILDYPLAFACMGAAGLFRRQPVLGAMAAGGLRLFCHVLSGVIFFGSYAPEGENPWIYSTVYNAGYMIPALILSSAVALILWRKMEQRPAR